MGGSVLWLPKEKNLAFLVPYTTLNFHPMHLKSSTITRTWYLLSDHEWFIDKAGVQVHIKILNVTGAVQSLSLSDYSLTDERYVYIYWSTRVPLSKTEYYLLAGRGFIAAYATLPLSDY